MGFGCCVSFPKVPSCAGVWGATKNAASWVAAAANPCNAARTKLGNSCAFMANACFGAAGVFGFVDAGCTNSQPDPTGATQATATTYATGAGNGSGDSGSGSENTGTIAPITPYTAPTTSTGAPAQSLSACEKAIILAPFLPLAFATAGCVFAGLAKWCGQRPTSGSGSSTPIDTPRGGVQAPLLSAVALNAGAQINYTDPTNGSSGAAPFAHLPMGAGSTAVVVNAQVKPGDPVVIDDTGGKRVVNFNSLVAASSPSAGASSAAANGVNRSGSDSDDSDAADAANGNDSSSNSSGSMPAARADPSRGATASAAQTAVAAPVIVNPGEPVVVIVSGGGHRVKGAFVQLAVDSSAPAAAASAAASFAQAVKNVTLIVIQDGQRQVTGTFLGKATGLGLVVE